MGGGEGTYDENIYSGFETMQISMKIPPCTSAKAFIILQDLGGPQSFLLPSC